MSNTANQDPSTSLHMTVYASLMAALIAAGAYIAVPVGPVPIVLQNMFVLLAGLLLGWRWGLAAVAVYLLAGICGLPVFAGGTGGIGRLLGPTGGYLLGYIPAVIAVGWIAGRREHALFFDLMGLVAGTAVVYLCGVPWLKMVTGMSLGKSMAAGLYPFLLGDGLKIVAAAAIAKAVRPVIRKESGAAPTHGYSRS
jgi:biotin transport system substrate-specific component